MDEMVRASLSHPSVVLHGFFNEGPSDDAAACAAYNASAAAVRALALPSHRLVTWASDKQENDVCLPIADVVAFNDYPGWYDSRPLEAAGAYWDGMAAWAAAAFPAKPFVISETGGGGVYEWSRARNGSATPKWSQAYQAALVANDAAAALPNPNISGISIWQFNDIKADDRAQSTCGPCTYSRPYDAAVPNDCAFINVSCWRPAGENHKGLVDLWRRPKASFAALRAAYAKPAVETW